MAKSSRTSRPSSLLLTRLLASIARIVGGFPELRIIDLTFPHLPGQAPTPTPIQETTATPTPAQRVPKLPIFVFGGKVTINGSEPAYAGFEITARIGDIWESPPAQVGTDPSKPFEYFWLVIAPDPELDLYGSELEFWLAGLVRSSARSIYAVLEGEGCPGCETYPPLPILRRVDLDFPFLPDLTPTPTPTASASPTSTLIPATATPEPSVTPTPTSSPVPPTATPEPSLTPTYTPSPVPSTATPAPTSTPTPTPTPLPPTATAIPTSSPTATPIASSAPPSSTPAPTSTPVPTPTPIPPPTTPEPTATNVPTPPPVPATATPVVPLTTTISGETNGELYVAIPIGVVLVLVLLAAIAYARWRYAMRDRFQR